MATTTTVFIGERFVDNGVINGFDGIFLYRYNIAVIEGSGNIFPSGAVHDASPRYEFEIFKDSKEFLLPFVLGIFCFFHRCHGLGLAFPDLPGVFFPRGQVLVLKYICTKGVSGVIVFYTVVFRNCIFILLTIGLLLYFKDGVEYFRRYFLLTFQLMGQIKFHCFSHLLFLKVCGIIKFN